MTLLDLLLFVVLPYAAVGQLLPALLMRRKPQGPLLYAVGSAELRADRATFWSRPAWVGAAILFALHVAPFLFRSAWEALVAARLRLLIVEVVALTGGLLFLVGIAPLLRRRLRDARLSPLRTAMEIGTLASLLAAGAAGVITAVGERWGSAWYATVVGPYLWSLVRLAPDVAPLTTLGFWPRAHIVLAFVAMALVPFTTLPRQMSAPVRHLRALAGGAR